MEQNCPYQDMDYKDQKCFHLMVFDGDVLAAYCRLLPAGVSFEEIEKVLLDWFPVPQISMPDIQGIVELLYNDKKNHSGKIQCCLLENIGTCVYDQPVEEAVFADALVYLMSKSVSLN